MKVSLHLTDDAGQQFEGEVILTLDRPKGDHRRREDSALHRTAAGAARKPKDGLESLHRKGIFKTERAFAAVETELAKLDYNFPKPTLMMALKNADFLTRRGQKGNYRWIQRFASGA